MTVAANRQALTIITTVRAGCEERLRSLLDAYGDSLQQGGVSVPFHLIETIHFCRWVVLPAIVFRGEQLPARLLFCSHHDGTREEQLADLSTKMGDVLDRVYEFCQGYPGTGERTTVSRASFLEKHVVRNDAIFIGTPYRTVAQIRQEDRLRSALQERSDLLREAGLSARGLRRALQDAVRKDERFEWAQAGPPPGETTWVKMTVAILAAPILLPFAALWLLLLRLLFERNDRPVDLKLCDLNPAVIRELERREDISAQSPFSQLMDIKPGRYRMATLKMMLWVSDFLGRYLFKNGHLMHIPSIHFYTWIILPEGRLLFLSNFDGSWQNYLGDFIDKAGWGLNGILSNCAGFPCTWFLFAKGVSDVEHYKAWARWANIPTQTWYTAYPALSVKNINNNTKIRAGLIDELDEARCLEWLGRF